MWASKYVVSWLCHAFLIALSLQLSLMDFIKGYSNLEVRENITKDQTSTPVKVPPHERLDSPGVSPVQCHYMSAREVYEMGMRKPKESWKGNSVFMAPRVNKSHKGDSNCSTVTPKF